MITDARKLITIFNDTVKKSITTFQEKTQELIDSTRVYFSEDLDNIVSTRVDSQEIYFMNNTGTLECARKYAGKHRVAVLNFADALEPGGLVLVGEKTQEENICRCSNLYKSITSSNARSYYNTNLNSESLSPGMYTHTLIYSPHVIVFKEDEDYTDIEPYTVDVITCPAPSCRIADEDEALNVYKRRIIGIMKVASHYDIDVLVLGAWGCGAFGQDPILIGKAFGEVCNNIKAFDKVIFAVRGGRSYNPLKTGFKLSYRGTIHE